MVVPVSMFILKKMKLTFSEMTNNLELVLLKNIIHPIEGGSQMLV